MLKSLVSRTIKIGTRNLILDNISGTSSEHIVKDEMNLRSGLERQVETKGMLNFQRLGHGVGVQF